MNHDLQQLRSVLEERERIDPDAPKAIVFNREQGEADACEKAFNTLQLAMKDDSAYAWTWHCNLAMCAVDEGVDLATANQVANRFMQLCFDVDTKQPDGGGK